MLATTLLKLQNAGFTEDQVKALDEMVSTQIATKADIELVRADLGGTLRLHAWMLAANTALLLMILGKLLLMR